MITKYTPEKLKAFEDWTVETFNSGKLKSPVHLSGSIDGELENFLIETFKQIKPNDWVATTYRSHYHALLKGVPEQRLKDWILQNKSIHFMDKEYKILSSAIVGGTLPIAVGIALGIKLRSEAKKGVGTLSNSLPGVDEAVMGEIDNLKEAVQDADTQLPSEDNSEKVWVFCGDMTSQTGIFHECLKYSVNFDLPIIWVIENNNLSTDTLTAESWGVTRQDLIEHFEKMKRDYPDYFDFVTYERKFPHYGTGKFISKLWEGVDETKKKGF